MADFLFWKPYNTAKLYGDFRSLIEAIENDDPRSRHPAVLRLLAQQVKDPKMPSRKTGLRDSIRWVERISWEILHDDGPERGRLERAFDRVLKKHPGKNTKDGKGRQALMDHWKRYKQAVRTHDAID